ncbi:phage tail protein [Clostridium sp. MB40-C1]|uniref:major tail protein n=1 Tax=Clostridium sp. MB40-C1 TaxID=3070996 RepID=UPI0027E0996C|nr:major tail protein [Clostridium sp. MB40-C1]WMJ81973.1 phage tail protein [Clostridium sp. MB40-C1]
MDKVVPIVDLKKLYVAEVKEDGLTSVFGEPRYYEGVKELGLKPKISSDEFFAEGILWLSDTTLANIDVEIDITDLKQEEEAFLLGHKLAKEGGIIRSANDKAPEVALLYKAIKGNGKARYGIMYKGVFSVADENYKSKEGKTNYQTKKLKGTFAPLHSNEMWNWKVDEEDGMTDEKFFASVIIPTEKTILDK